MAEGRHGEPMRKKRKTGEIHPIFQSFLASNKKADLENAVVAVDLGLSNLTLGVLFVDSSNALNTVSFKDSTINTSVLSLKKGVRKDGELPKGAALGDIFFDGVDVLKKYLDKEHPKIPEDPLQQKALQILLTFLTSEEDHGFVYEEQDKKSVWSVTLAQHLLSKLAVDSTFTIASSSDVTVGASSCPCKERDKLVGKVGDTSYGCSKGWHGKPDIIMKMKNEPVFKDSVPISVFQDEDDSDASEDDRDEYEDEDDSDEYEDDSDSPEDSADSTIEVKRTMQIMAQTIVFSFLKRKLNEGILKNCLIPGVGIVSKNLIVCFYDSENDVLLKSKNILIFEGKIIRTPAVLFLWLTLNYQLFCSGITREMKTMKSDFMRKLGENGTIYTDDVTKPVHVPHKTQDYLSSWATEPETLLVRNESSLNYIDLPV